MDSKKLFIYLLPAESDPPLRSPEYQQGLNEVSSALSAQGIKFSYLVELEEAAGSNETIVLGYTIEVAKIAGPVLAGIIYAWIQGRYGRKARLKIGDTEAAARTPEEVEKLIATAKKLRQAKR